MYERFTERARQVVVLAQDEAHKFGHGQISPEHILLGLLREEEGVAARVLIKEEVHFNDVSNSVRDILGEDETTSGQLSFSPKAKKVMELALREALSMGHNYVGTEHLLLAVAREKSVASNILHYQYQLTYDDLRELVTNLLFGKVKKVGSGFSDLNGIHLAALERFLERARKFGAGEITEQEYIGE
jgi:ATP-dependent Clp protease ATP-binding subunit ClpC